ncbi:MAG: translation initiation factor IF-2 [Clostridiales bacterium]|nr:translation initiation factor IF-2 [Clostridiales bacterium]
MEVKKEEKKEFSFIKNLGNLIKENKGSVLVEDFKGVSKSIEKKLAEKAKLLAKQKAEELQKLAEQQKKEEVVVQPVEEVKVEEPIKEVEVPVEVETKTEEVKVEETVEVKEEVKPEQPVEEKKEEPKAPVIQKTDNPNIVIIDGKRVFVPQGRREYVVKDDKKPNPNNKKPSNVGRTYNAENGAQNKREYNNNQGERKPYQPSNKPAPTAPQFVPKENNRTQGKKKNERNNYEDKKAINKKSLIKGQVSIDDFDEDKTGYRKMRKSKDKHQEETVSTVKIEKAVINKEIIAVKELSELLGITAVEITKRLFKEGIMKTINDSIDYDTAGFIAAELGIELELKLDKTAEDVLSEGFKDDEEDVTKLIKRPPVVTVMGHVDHGKTSLLDKIRNANVTAGEAGGITQHIGAYTVNVNGETITFLDTPGHAAFTAMRARGAQLTDIAIIVVAADDGIMPQTIEAIHHAKAAGVTIIVAANKMDKQTADIERVKKGLADQEILVEEWGGDVALVPVSAKTGAGIDELLETVIISAEMKELKANPDRMAKGIIVEAKLDKGKGPVATVLVQSGTLKVGDYLVAGTITGKVRAMVDDKGRNVKTAGPSMPVSILGLESVPNAGDSLFAVEEAKLGALVASERKNREREEMIREQQKISLDDLFSKVSSGDLKNLNLIVKADVQGSVEAIKQSLIELSNEEVKVNVIHSAVGAISETDVNLADSSNSIIIGFNVRPDAKAKTLAEQNKIDIKLYRVIYEAIDDVNKALKGMLAPKFSDVYLGKAEVRETFKITGVGTVAGCYVTDGKIVRNGKLRIYREDVMICEGNVLQLKRFKDDVKEVQQGFECGMSIEKFDDIKIGDFIECYIVEEQKA